MGPELTAMTGRLLAGGRPRAESLLGRPRAVSTGMVTSMAGVLGEARRRRGRRGKIWVGWVWSGLGYLDMNLIFAWF